MDREASRFVYDQYVVVLVHDLQRDVLSSQVNRRDRRNVDADTVSRAQSRGWPGRDVVDKDVPLPDELLNPRPREVQPRRGHISVQACAVLIADQGRGVSHRYSPASDWREGGCASKTTPASES